jgi:hypothetical protein
VANITLWAAGLYVSTAPHEAAFGTFTTSVARARQIALRITTTAVFILETELANDATTARGLTNLHAGRSERCAKTTAAIAAPTTHGTLHAVAIRGHGERQPTGTYFLTLRDIAPATTAVAVAGTNVTVLNAIGRTNEADAVLTKLRTTGFARCAGVASSTAAWIERRANAVDAALTATFAI